MKKNWLLCLLLVISVLFTFHCKKTPNKPDIVDDVEMIVGALQRLTDFAPTGYHLSWSPDGRSLAYTYQKNEEYDLYVLPVDSALGHALNLPYSGDLYVDWNPAGDRLVFDVYTYQNSIRRSRLATAPAVGGDVEFLTDGSQQYWGPTWSPDGTEIACFNSAIHILNLASGQMRQLTVGHHPNWSWDGSQIIFTSDRNGSFDIYSISPLGGEVTRLTRHSGREDRASLSPDGTKLAYVTDRYGNDQIEIKDIQTSQIWRLGIDNDWESMPAWSPDGGRLAFCTHSDIFIVTIVFEDREETE